MILLGRSPTPSLSVFSICTVPPTVREVVQVRSMTASGTVGPKKSGM